MVRITKGIPLYIDTATSRLRWGWVKSLECRGVSLKLWLTFEGECETDSGMVINVTEIARALREKLNGEDVQKQNALEIIHWIWQEFESKYHARKLMQAALDIHEALRIARIAKEPNMVKITTKYELAASHRLRNRSWDEKRNREIFGKCSNPAGHGHNYILEITLGGKANKETGEVVDLEMVDRIVREQIIDRYDHKNLNEDINEFADLLPTVENMAKVFWERLTGQFGEVRLESVRVWETPQCYAEYSG